MEAVNDMSTAFATLHYGGPSSQKYVSYWTHGPAQYSGSPLTKVKALGFADALQRNQSWGVILWLLVLDSFAVLELRAMSS